MRWVATIPIMVMVSWVFIACSDPPVGGEDQGQPGPEAGPLLPEDAESIDATIAVVIDAGDGAIDAGDGPIDAGDGAIDAGDGAIDAGDGPIDAGGGALPSPPWVPGPPPETYDCRGADTPVQERRSPVPLDCITDPDCDLPLVVGHRATGGSFGVIAPENSLAAIRAALLMGLDGVELDVRATADGQLVLMHDNDVSATTDGSGRVDEMTAAEVTELTLKPPQHPDPALDARIGDFSCERVPLFRDALALTRGRLFIDLDTKTDRVDLIVDAINAMNLRDEVFISVSGLARALRARALDPAIRVQVRPDSPDELETIVADFEDLGLRMPEVFEFEVAHLDELAPRVRALGSTPFVNAFAADVVAYATQSPDPYLDLYRAGAQILQSEFPSQVLEALDR